MVNATTQVVITKTIENIINVLWSTRFKFVYTHTHTTVSELFKNLTIIDAKSILKPNF